MRKPYFYNKEKSNDKTQTLANALSGRKTIINNSTPNFSSPIQYGSVSTTQGENSNQGGQFVNNLVKLGTKLYDNWQSGSGGTDGGGLVSGAIDSYISGGGGSSSPIMSALTSSGGGGSAISDAIGSNIASSGAGGGGSWFSNLFSGSGSGGGLFGSIGSSGAGGSGGFSFGGGGGGGGTPWGLIGKTAKTGYNTFSDQNDTDYSDLEEGVIYPLQGASAGAQFGPWGALGGAVYGLGYGFKDDIGLKDNDWLTTILFPIGMGDEHQGLIQI